jgi:DNA-binding CsgD family transcriptional regulator
MIASGIAAEADAGVRDWLDTALEAARQRGDGLRRTRTLAWRALAGLQAGRAAEAWSDARDACTDDLGALGDNDWLAVLGLVSVAVETGDPWLAERLQALLAQPQHARLPMRTIACQALWAVSDAGREPPVGVEDLLKVVSRAESAGWRNQSLFSMGLWCVPALLRLDATDAALELLARACERAREFGSPAALGRVLRIWGTLVRERYALSLLAESVTVLRRGTNTLELGRALTAYGNRLREAGRPGSAELLAEAGRIADATGASAVRCWAAAPPGSEPPGAASPGGRLSDTERRVAALVAGGHTNQEVAAELGVTRRAVEKTLTGLYRRTGVTGRAQLVPVIRRTAGEAVFRTGLLCDRL